MPQVSCSPACHASLLRHVASGPMSQGCLSTSARHTKAHSLCAATRRFSCTCTCTCSCSCSCSFSWAHRLYPTTTRAQLPKATPYQIAFQRLIDRPQHQRHRASHDDRLRLIDLDDLSRPFSTTIASSLGFRLSTDCPYGCQHSLVSHKTWTCQPVLRIGGLGTAAP